MTAVLCTALLALSASAAAVDYHLSLEGDDARDGRSPEAAWRSLERVPVGTLAPGDRVLLRGGDTFQGCLRLTRSGTAGQPITLASYGSGRAAIAPPPGADGIAVIDAGHLVLRDLDLLGPGAAAASGGSGVLLQAQSARSAGLVLARLRCADFPIQGICLHSDTPGMGFDDVLVEDCVATGCGEGGMGSWGPCRPGVWSFRRVQVRGSRFHGNRGRPDKRTNHSGNGIILGDCQEALIERCAAWANGDLCHSKVGGPVGIWLCESDRSVIRACLSFRNRSGPGVPDGGGFDLDGGCTGCVIEDCLSWRNDGAGYLVCQYKDARPFRGNVVRNCISVGDGRARVDPEKAPQAA